MMNEKQIVNEEFLENFEQLQQNYERIREEQKLAEDEKIHCEVLAEKEREDIARCEQLKECFDKTIKSLAFAVGSVATLTRKENDKDSYVETVGIISKKEYAEIINTATGGLNANFIDVLMKNMNDSRAEKALQGNMQASFSVSEIRHEVLQENRNHPEITLGDMNAIYEKVKQLSHKLHIDVEISSPQLIRQKAHMQVVNHEMAGVGIVLAKDSIEHVKEYEKQFHSYVAKAKKEQEKYQPILDTQIVIGKNGDVLGIPDVDAHPEIEREVYSQIDSSDTSVAHKTIADQTTTDKSEVRGNAVVLETVENYGTIEKENGIEQRDIAEKDASEKKLEHQNKKEKSDKSDVDRH